MPETDCDQPLSMQQLLSYWLDESGDAACLAIEEHLFSCGSCSASLERLMSLGHGIRAVLRTGRIAAVLPSSFLQNLRHAGLRVREYRLEPQGSVNCTVAPDDDLVLARLKAPLANVQRLDAVLADLTAGEEFRFADVSFSPTEGEVVLLPEVAKLRQIKQATQRVQLLAVDDSGERLIGDYWFHHTGFDDQR